MAETSRTQKARHAVSPMGRSEGCGLFASEAAVSRVLASRLRLTVRGAVVFLVANEATASLPTRSVFKSTDDGGAVVNGLQRRAPLGPVPSRGKTPRGGGGLFGDLLVRALASTSGGRGGPALGASGARARQIMSVLVTTLFTGSWFMWQSTRAFHFRRTWHGKLS